MIDRQQQIIIWINFLAILNARPKLRGELVFVKNKSSGRLNLREANNHTIMI